MRGSYQTISINQAGKKTVFMFEFHDNLFLYKEGKSNPFSRLLDKYAQLTIFCLFNVCFHSKTLTDTAIEKNTQVVEIETVPIT